MKCIVHKLSAWAVQEFLKLNVLVSNDGIQRRGALAENASHSCRMDKLKDATCTADFLATGLLSLPFSACLAAVTLAGFLLDWVKVHASPPFLLFTPLDTPVQG